MVRPDIFFRLEEIWPIPGSPARFFFNPLHRLPESHGRVRQPAHPGQRQAFLGIKVYLVGGSGNQGRSHAVQQLPGFLWAAPAEGQFYQDIFGLNQFKILFRLLRIIFGQVDLILD